MLLIARPVVVLTALAGWLVLAASAAAGPTGVIDGAGLFKPATVQRVNEQAEQIQRRYQTDLLIETVKQLAPEQLDAYKKLRDAVALRRFYLDLAEKQAKERGATGIYVWVCREPWRVEVLTGPDVGDDRFPTRDRRQLRDRFTRRLEKTPDSELIRGVEYVAATVNTASRPAAWPWALPLVAAVLALWLVVGQLGGKERPGEVENRGARISNGLISGLFSTAGGLWLYQFFSNKLPPAGAAPPPPPPEPAPVEENLDDGDAVVENRELTVHAPAPAPADPHARADGRLD
jgi:hypothetical protein